MPVCGPIQRHGEAVPFGWGNPESRRGWHRGEPEQVPWYVSRIVHRIQPSRQPENYGFAVIVIISGHPMTLLSRVLANVFLRWRP